MSTRPTTTTTKARETATVAPKSELSDYFGHYVVASKGTNRNSGNARFSSMSSMSSKNCLGRKQIFAAHRDDKAKDVLICEGEQTRNRGSYTFYSPKNLPQGHVVPPAEFIVKRGSWGGEKKCGHLKLCSFV